LSALIKKLKGDWILDLQKTKVLNEKQKNLLAELLIQSFYQFDKYLSQKEKNYSLKINTEKKLINHLETLQDSLYFTRDLINEPPVAVNPESMEQIIKKRFKNNVKIKIIK
jgi:leucyl aminopeptidase